jgi:major vault protein
MVEDELTKASPLPSYYIPKPSLQKGKTMAREDYDDRGRGGQRSGDLVLLLGTYAYVADSTKGRVSVCVGPYRTSLSETDQLVRWNSEQGQFVPADTGSAVNTFVRAGEGQYVVLSDPAKSNDKKSPPTGTTTDAVELSVGGKVIVPGPANFPLWPGQTAQVIDGHRLRSNQYLMVRVVQPDEAKRHWENATLAPATAIVAQAEAEESLEGAVSDDDDAATVADDKSTTPAPTEVSVLTDSGKVLDLTMGQLIVVKGTEVSFYIPSTGLEVVPDEHGNFIREAATLERVEYCILLDESGDKRYVQGPAVVFPSPTETFVQRKARAIELNPESGLYIKVIADYKDGTKEHKVGDELFITGADQSIYFPRPEHAIIAYDGQTKHHAIAIPAGDGRYVLDKTTGKVDLVRGPKMYLPDPRTKVVVRRILDPWTVAVMYPSNKEALAVNQRYRQELTDESGFLQGVVSRSEHGIRGEQVDEFPGDTMSRGNTYTPPRTIVLDNKYAGAVAVNVWPGYAVMVTDKLGKRRVEVGPKSILLEYDESLMVLELSTGRPKSDDSLLRAVYLRTVNNTVGDLVTVETRDLVPVSIELSYRVNFEGETDAERVRWFDIENYIKVLTDHCRSRLGSIAKQYDVQTFYARTIEIVRDALLGDKPAEGERSGLRFEQNGMRLYDVEILRVRIADREVSGMLSQATADALEGAIALSQAQERAKREAALEALKRQSLEETEKTRLAEAGARLAQIKRNLKAAAQQAAANLTAAEDQRKIDDVQRASEQAQADQDLANRKAKDDAALKRLAGEVQQFVKRLTAVDAGFLAAIREFGDQQFVDSLITALGPAALVAGTTPAELLEQVFESTPFAGAIKALGERPITKRNK